MSRIHENPAQAIYDELVEIKHVLKEILMSTTPTGLASLQQAVADLTAAVAAATAALQNTGDSDATVGSLASDVETQIAALKSATPAPAAPPAA